MFLCYYSKHGLFGNWSIWRYLLPWAVELFISWYMQLLAIEMKAPRVVFVCGFLILAWIDFRMLILVDTSILGPLKNIWTYIIIIILVNWFIPCLMMVGVAEILDFCDFLSPTPEEQSARNAAIESVFNVIRYIWPNCKV